MDVNSRSAIHYTPLHFAANAGLHQRDALCDSRPDTAGAGSGRQRPHAPTPNPPLHRAAACGRARLVQTFLAVKADPSLRDSDGQTALDLAIAGKHKECADLLRAPRQVQTPAGPMPNEPQKPNLPAGERKP